MTPPRAVLLFAALTLASPARAFRPLNTEDAEITAPRKLDLELGWDWSHRADEARKSVVLGTLNYGLAPRLELDADLNWTLMHRPQGPTVGGVGDSLFAVKGLLSAETPRLPALALRAGWKAPTGDAARELGSGDDDFLLMGAASKKWGGHSAHAMLGRTWVGRSADPALRDYVFYGFGADVALNKKVSVLAEAFGSGPLSTDSSDEAALRLGGIYTVSERLLLDFSVRRSLKASAHYWGTSIGLTTTFF